MKRARVLQIDRVQNLRLWTKHIIRHNEVAELAGKRQSKQRFLFHGSNPGVRANLLFDLHVHQWLNKSRKGC